MLATPDEDNRMGYGSRRNYVFLIMYQTVGTINSLTCVQTALERGPLGYTLTYILAIVFIGVPILNMELIISQFTGRDAIEIWKARPFLSHMGYMQLILLFVTFIRTHALTTFNIHYLMLSFENPIPYHRCGSWSTQDCNILRYNYTINLNCIRLKGQNEHYCKRLYDTFPETQYWRYVILGNREPPHFYITWRIMLGSALVCIVVYLNCFKRFKSLKVCLMGFAIYPFLGYFLLTTGTMMQKGMVLKFEEALDSSFSRFKEKARFSCAIQQVVSAMGLGSGVIPTLAAGTMFRSPCYTNSMVVALISSIFTVVCILCSAMMYCPYSYEYGMKPVTFMSYPITYTFEKTPRALAEYNLKTFWIILFYSCQVILGVSTELLHFYVLSEVSFKRFPKLAEYPSLACLGGVLILYVSSIPVLATPINNYSINVGVVNTLTILTSFFTTIECFVFIVWYGLERLSEDVHFMQGIQPNNFMKLSWVLSGGIMLYAFIYETAFSLVRKWKKGMATVIAAYIVIGILGMCTLITIGRLLYALYKKRFMEEISLDPTWGPKSELLYRSRAMFTAQAMTKEYMYRQYHLQAGIIARQKRSNIRRPPNETKFNVATA